MNTRARLVRILLWYNVVSMAIWVGGTVYQMLVVVPLWSASPPETVTAFFKGTQYLAQIPRFFGPRTMALRVLPIGLLLIAGWNERRLRPLLIVTAATVAIGLAMTLLWIYPINDALFWRAGEGVPVDALRTMVDRWIFLDRLRFALMGVGYLALLRAFSLSGSREPEPGARPASPPDLHAHR